MGCRFSRGVEIRITVFPEARVPLDDLRSPENSGDSKLCNGWTWLHYAAWYGLVSDSKELIQIGFDVCGIDGVRLM